MILATLFTGISCSINNIENASNNNVKPLPALAQGTSTYAILASSAINLGTLKCM
jgi:hypothetical protein